VIHSLMSSEVGALRRGECGRGGGLRQGIGCVCLCIDGKGLECEYLDPNWLLSLVPFPAWLPCDTIDKLAFN
jgi:hypothetical protein